VSDEWEVPFYRAEHLGFPTCEIELCRKEARWITQGALVEGGVMVLCPAHKRVLDGEVRRFSDEMLAILRTAS
jgi:hypothetical protein